MKANGTARVKVCRALAPSAAPTTKTVDVRITAKRVYVPLLDLVFDRETHRMVSAFNPYSAYSYRLESYEAQP
jgi:hypothetical protein